MNETKVNSIIALLNNVKLSCEYHTFVIQDMNQREQKKILGQRCESYKEGIYPNRFQELYQKNIQYTKAS